MKRAGKKILASLLALLLIFSLAACGGNPSKNGDGEVIFNIMSTEQSKKPCGARHSGPFVV